MKLLYKDSKYAEFILSINNKKVNAYYLLDLHRDLNNPNGFTHFRLIP